jgi:riboflavin biosynthesis pyrimidine reductase
LVRLQPKNQLAKQLNLTPKSALTEISNFFANNETAQILVEAGPKLLTQMIDEGLINTLYLTINHGVTGENLIDLSELVKTFKLVSSEKIADDEFQKYELA